MEFSRPNAVGLVVPRSVWHALNQECDSPRTAIHFPDSIEDVNKFTVGGETQIYRRSSCTSLNEYCKMNQPKSPRLNQETFHRQTCYNSSFNGARKRVCCGDEELQIPHSFYDEQNLKLSRFLKSDYLAQAEQSSSESYSSNSAAFKSGMEELQLTIETANSKKTLLSDIVQKGNWRNNCTERPWGRCSYSDLIAMALQTSPTKCMILAQIYDWIVDNVPYFKDKGSCLSVTGWKNAIRHTLSLRKRFTRVPDPNRPYKTMWTLTPPRQKRNQNC